MSDDAVPDDAAPHETEWQRVHPATVVFELVKALQQAVIGLVVVAGGGFFNSAIELLVIAGPLGAAVARWYTTRYAVDADAIRHEYGLIWRRKQVMPRDRVQNVTSRSNLIARALGLVELQVSEASSGGDIDIRYIDADAGARLAALLRSGVGPSVATGTAAEAREGADGEGPGTSPGDPAPPAAIDIVDPDRLPALHSPTFGQVLRVQVVRNLFAVGFGTLSLAVFVLGPLVVGRLAPDVDVGGPVTSSVGVVLALAMTVATSAGRVLALGDFHLWDEPDRLRIRSGLLTEHRQTVRRERIQALRVDHHAFLRRIGREQVAFETADLEVGAGGTASVLSPASPWGSWPGLASVVFGPVGVAEEQLTPVSRATVARISVRWAALAALESGLFIVIAAAAGAGHWWPLALGVFAVTSGLGRLHAVLRWRRLGWVTDDRHLLFRAGVVATRLHLIDLDKVQIVRTESSFFQRRRNLASVSLSTAGRRTAGSITIPDLDIAAAERLAAELVARSIATPLDRTI